MAAAGCGSRDREAIAAAGAPEVLSVATAAVVEEPVTRFIRVSGTLAAQEEAEVAAEVAGRVVATPIERGSRVARNGTLIQIADTEVAAQRARPTPTPRRSKRGSGRRPGRRSTSSAWRKWPTPAPPTSSRRPSSRAPRCCRSASSCRDRNSIRSRRKSKPSRRQYEVAKNGAEQQYQALMGARARVAMARKALDDTVVRAPFDGVVGERLVSVGDYVTRGTKVASVMRVSPLRLELTVPAQYVTAVAVGSAVSLEVDAMPGETFVGQVRFVSPALRSDTRALVVEAVVDNADGRLKPGLFATARIEQAAKTPALLVPAHRGSEDGDGQSRVRRRRRSRRGAADYDRTDRGRAGRGDERAGCRRSRRRRAGSSA